MKTASTVKFAAAAVFTALVVAPAVAAPPKVSISAVPAERALDTQVKPATNGRVGAPTARGNKAAAGAGLIIGGLLALGAVIAAVGASGSSGSPSSR